MILRLYHGSDNHSGIFDSDFDVKFFSTSDDFSRDYGEVKIYEVEIENPFYSTSKEHIELLLNSVGELLDTYDNTYYYSYEELVESGTFYSDTWEIFERYINVIKRMGFDSLVIYEGGIENYALFYPQNQIKEF